MRGDHPANEIATAKNLLIYGMNQAWVVERLISGQALGKDDFAWRNQLKPYYDPAKKWVYFTIRDMRQYYGYCYHGNETSLVITELSEMSYAYMFEAIDAGKRFAAHGPAGTGKTETIKQLSRDLGLETLVVNCNEETSAETLSGFIKASANEGQWLICDEGNHMLPEEVTKLAGLLKAESDCRFFITYNPGSPWRKQFTPEFAAQLHSLAFTLPNRPLIFEVQLAMRGFTQAKNLAAKQNYFMQYAENVFSKQRHYDYGLRFAMKLFRLSEGRVKAALEKGEITALVENSLFYQVLLESQYSRLTAEDHSICVKILKEIFYGYEAEEKTASGTETTLTGALDSMNLNSRQASKMVSLWRNCQTRHGNAVLGPSSMSGTKALVNALISALDNTSEPVNKIEIDADSATVDELYSPTGLITAALEQSQSDEETWIVIQGGNDAEKSENMNTLLDDNKKLCLANGNIVPLGPRTKIVYLWDSVSNLGPAALSRVDIVYLEPAEADFN